MKSRAAVFTSAFAFTLLLAGAWIAVGQRTRIAAPPIPLYGAAHASEQRAQALLAAQPVAFEPAGNRAGDDGERYLMRGPGYTVFFDAGGPVVMVRDPRPSGLLAMIVRLVEARWSPGAVDVHRLPLRFEQPAGPIQWRALEPRSSYSNYFAGSDPARWQSHVPHFGRLWAANVYPGIDLTFHGTAGELEYDFRVAPGADAAQIRWRTDAADRVELTASGALRLRVGPVTIELRQPVAYQVIDGQRREVAVRFDRRAGSVGFALGDYERSLPLVIDPVLAYAGFVGGGDNTTNALGLAIDSSGNAYVSGSTCAADFPSTPGAVGTKGGAFFLVDACEDAFVTKLKADGSGLAYSTFLRGSDRETAMRIAVDASGSAYVTGVTLSLDFPTTVGAYSRSAKSGNCVVAGGLKMPCTDAFVSKLSPDGASLVYSTYLGGSGMDAGIGIAVDAAGAAYVSGWTNSPDLPVSATAFQKTYGGGSCASGLVPCLDTFVAKLAPDGASLAYLTYLGGDKGEFGINIAVDAAGNAVMVGATTSANFPTTPGVVGPAHTAGTQADIHVTKLSPTGSALVFSTLLGGSGADRAIGLALDATGAVYVSGHTKSPDFPVTPGAYQTTFAGPADGGCQLRLGRLACGDAFVFKLNPTGTALVFSTFLGGAGDDAGHAVAVDSAQHVWVTGMTRSPTFPSTPDAYYPGGDAGGIGGGFLAELSADGKQLLYGSSLRGGATVGTDLAIDSADNVYVLGVNNGGSNALPASPGAFSTGSGGALVMKFNVGAAPKVQLSATTLAFANQNVRSISAPQTVVISNPSTAPLQLALSFAASPGTAPSTAFLQTSDCPPVLAASQSCNVAVRFQPQASGQAGATLLVNSNAPGSPNSIGFSGLGIDNQTAAFIPGQLAFPDQQAGTTSARATAGLQPQATDSYAKLKSLTVGGANPGDFDVNLTNCTISVGSCSIDAAFKPLSASTGTRSATVILNADLYGGSIVLPLTGRVATGPTLVVTPTAIDYATASTAATTQQLVILKNTGSGAVSIASFTLSPADYSISSGGSCGTPPIALTAQASCTVFLQFRPAQSGRRDGSFSIADDSTGSPHAVALTGVGADPTAAWLRVTSSSGSTFGPVLVGTSQNVPLFFTAANFGGQAATLAITTPPEFPLSTTFNTCTATLASNSSCIFAVGFAPTAVGARTGSLTLASNAVGAPVTIPLAGTGIAIPTDAPTPQQLDFGRIGLNITSPVRTVTIPNSGNATLNLAGITATGPFAVTNHCGATLAPGASCTVDLRATPVAVGGASGLLTVNDDAIGGQHGVMLTVEGVNGPAVQADLAAIDFGRQAVGGSSAARAVTITNTGAAAASLTGVVTNGDFVQTSTCGSSLAVGASCTASVSFRPTLVSDPLPLVGLLSIGGGFTGSPLLVGVHGLGTAATGAATRTQLSASPNPATTGQAVTLTASVTSSTAGTPSGTLTFLDGATTLGTATLAAGQGSVTTSSLTAGAHPITAQYSGDTTYAASTSAAVAVQVNTPTTAPDFALQAAPTTLTVVAGQSASTTLTLAPANGFAQAVSFTCAGLPAGASCSFAPASVTPNGGPVTTVLTIATNGSTVTASARSGDPSGGPAGPGPAAPLVLASVGVAVLRIARPRPGAAPDPSHRAAPRRLRAWGVLAALAMVVSIVACGGSSSDGDSGTVVGGGGTPAGTSTVTVTATSASGSVSHAITLSLVVTR